MDCRACGMTAKRDGGMERGMKGGTAVELAVPFWASGASQI
jgi:hypothetical protein